MMPAAVRAHFVFGLVEAATGAIDRHVQRFREQAAASQ